MPGGLPKCRGWEKRTLTRPGAKTIIVALKTSQKDALGKM